MNPILSTLSQITLVLPLQLALRLSDSVRSQAGAAQAIPRADLLLCALFVAGWWSLILQAAHGISGLL